MMTFYLFKNNGGDFGSSSKAEVQRFLLVGKYDKVGRCLARYSPRAKANNTIPCNTIRYNAMT